MALVRLYVDEDAAETAVVEGLLARSINVVTTIDVNRRGSSDADQLAFAVANQRAIYTFNVRDFARLHREYLEAGRNHWGIIVIPDQRYSTGEKIRRLAGLVHGVTNEEMRDRIEFL